MNARKLAVLVLMSLSLAACGSKGKKDEKKEQPIVGAHGYSFADQGCTTGVKNYASVDEMCFYLQDELINNSCAFSQRKTKFDTSCLNTSFSFRESHYCQVTLLKPTAIVDSNTGVYNPEDLANPTASTGFCAGWETPSQATADFTKEIPNFVDTSTLKVRMKFLPRKISTPQFHSNFEVALERNVGGTPYGLLSHTYADSDYPEHKIGLTSDAGRYKFVVSCFRTNACKTAQP